MKTDLSIVVAVYNEEAVLPELHRRLTTALKAIGRSYEIILVDDGSRDRSFAIMQELRAHDPERVRPLSFTRNFGHHIALTAGLDHADGDVVIMMDADLQDQPEEISKLLAKLDDGFDVVWGARATRQFKWYKNLTSRMFLWLMNSVARSEVPLNSSIFRAMRRPVADDLRKLREQARYLPGLVSWLGYRETSVPVEHGARYAGETKYSLWRLIKLALSTATSFSTAPLQLATVSGMIAAAIAVLFVLYILVRELAGGYSVPGYASVMIAIFFFGALQLIVIGLMGEYVSRIYREAQGRPLYLLRSLQVVAPPKRKVLSKPTTEALMRTGEGTHHLSLLSQSEQDEIAAGMASDPHLPLANVFPSVPTSQLAAHYWEEWKKIDPIVFLSHHTELYEPGERISGVCLLEGLEFDTRLLGIRSARVTYANGFGTGINDSRITALFQVLSRMRGYAGGNQLQLIDARVSNQDLFVIRAFEAAGFHLVDMLSTLGASSKQFERALAHAQFSWKGPSEGPFSAVEFSPSLIVRPMQPDDEAALAQLSSDAFGDHTIIQDRFFLEPTIPSGRAQNLFREWFLNLARKQYEGNGIVLVAVQDGRLAGYLAMEHMPRFDDGPRWWQDSLNAVAPDARGQGIYRSLVVAAVANALRSGAGGLITKTQSSSYRVINTWLHLGCDVKENFATLHWTPKN